MKVRFGLLFVFLFFFVALNGCNWVTQSQSETSTLTTILTTNGTESTTTQTSDVLNIQLQYVYSLAVEAGSFTGTYEEWLETVTGPQGEPGIDGREVLFKVEGSVLKWQYVGDGLVWTNLIDLTSIISLPDKIVTDVWINASGNLIVTYDDASEANLGDFLRDFTVIFKDLTGSIIKVENVGYGEDATAPTPPVVVGHTFVSWEGDYIGVTEDIEVEAIYSVNQQMVSFVTNSDVALEP
ncbi:MAG: hypothetical protein WCR28_01045, partial [Candidatus Izemoplasmatales bacterium]